MVKITDIPNNMLYQFDDNRYLWNVELNSIRDGNYDNQRRLLTEVYELNGNNMLDLIASGRLVDNHDTVKESEFSIFDYDKDDMITFAITRPITRASIDKIYLLRDSINRRYNTLKK